MYYSSRLTFRLMTASEHYLVGTWEVANVFIPLEFSRGSDTKSHWHRTSMSWHNKMCGWVQLLSEHVLAHHLEIFESLGNTTIAAAPNTLIETVVLPSFKSFSRISSTISITHAGNPMNTCQGLGSAQSEQGFASNPFQAEVPEGFKSWADYLNAKIPTLTSTAIAGAFTKGYECMQHTASLVTEVFDQYIIARLGIVAAKFECKVDSVNKNVDWKQSLLGFCFRNIFCNTQRLTSILKADIHTAIQLGLNEIEAQLFSLMGEFQQKLLDEASALDGHNSRCSPMDYMILIEVSVPSITVKPNSKMS